MLLRHPCRDHCFQNLQIWHDCEEPAAASCFTSNSSQVMGYLREAYQGILLLLQGFPVALHGSFAQIGALAGAAPRSLCARPCRQRVCTVHAGIDPDPALLGAGHLRRADLALQADLLK